MFGRDVEVLKGKNPYDDWNDKMKKRTLKERIRDYCQDFHWDQSEHIKKLSDEDGESYIKPT